MYVASGGYNAIRVMQATTQQKQRFLREQILQQSYDADEFISFLCKDLHIEQLDVQHIDMPTLQSIVLKFKQYKYYQDPPKPQKRVKVDYDKNLYDYEYERRWKCIHAESLLDGVQVFVPNFEVREIGGVFLSFGSRTEVWYVVQSTAGKTPVKRQQEDFQWLSDTLVRLFPLQAIPQLVPIAKQSENNYQKRRKELEEYLQILAARPELRISNLLFDFLTLPADKLEKFKKNWESMGFAKGIQSIKNQEGYVSVSFTNKLRNFAQGSALFNRRAAAIHEGISASLERVNELHNSTAGELNKIVELFAELHQAYNELTNKSPQQKVHEYNDVLININNLFHIMAEDLNARARVFAAHLKEFHKVQLNYDRSVAKLYRNAQETEKEYLYFKTNLNRKKERLYPDVSRWEVDEKLIDNRRLTKEEAFEMMLPKQTQQEQQMRDWMAHLYGNYRTEFQRYIGFEVNRYVSVFCTLSAEMLLNNRTYVEEVTKFIEETQKTVK